MVILYHHFTARYFESDSAQTVQLLSSAQTMQHLLSAQKMQNLSSAQTMQHLTRAEALYFRFDVYPAFDNYHSGNSKGI